MKAAIWPLLAFAGMLAALFAITLPHWMRSYRALQAATPEERALEMGRVDVAPPQRPEVRHSERQPAAVAARTTSARERSNREPTQGLGELAYPADRPGGMNPRGFGSGTGPVLNPNTKAAPVQKGNTP